MAAMNQKSSVAQIPKSVRWALTSDKPESLGNQFAIAAKQAGVSARLHGLRKAFCIYWAEKGSSTHQIASMAGHMTLSEVERYTRAADRERIVKLLVEGA